MPLQIFTANSPAIKILSGMRSTGATWIPEAKEAS
jgi:hypothetical protein